MSKFISGVAKVGLYFTIIIGILTISTAAHELTHYFDIKDDVIVQDICLMNIPFEAGANGAYGFVRNLNYGIEPHSPEWKPMLIGLAVGLLFVMCLGYTIKHKGDRE